MPSALNCVDKSGLSHTFYLKCIFRRAIHPRVDHPHFLTDEWDISLYPKDPPDPASYFFTASAVRVDALTVMSKEMHANGYSGKGIPEAVIKYLQQLTGARIISSSYSKKTRIFEAEWQTPAGRGVWRRLERNGLAREIDGECRYEYIGP